MSIIIDKEYLVSCLKDIVSVPSPVGYYVKLNPLLEQMAAQLGYTVTHDNKSTTYITLEGEDDSKTVLVGAHADTLGMVVRCVDSSGMLCGVSYTSIEGESVTVHTRDGREYTGLVVCKSHSVHVFEDARSLERSEETIRILLDEDVKCKEDVRALGIRNGDIISIDPRFQRTPGGYIKCRFIDDKGGIACCFAMLKYLAENHLRPRYRTILAFPYAEEIGMGGTFVPEGVSEYIAVDIGLIGPELEGSERKVSICAKDAAAPYDYELTSRIIDLAASSGIDHAVDVFYRYSTDANAAQRAGNDLRSAAFGMAVYCSHGMERTHIDGLEATARLLTAYVVSG